MLFRRPATGGGRPIGTRLHVPLALVAVVALLLSALTGSPRRAVADASRPAPTWGVYNGPGPAGVRGARAYEQATGIHVTRVLDFLPDDTWDNLTNVGWLLDAYHGSGYELELSVPMLPSSGRSTLRACAQGAYDGHWRTIARRIRAAGLVGTVVRPGWEANGNWYRWSVQGNRWYYISCFRHVVDAMRSQDTDLRFSWSVNNGPNPEPGEGLFPGAAWVDEIGVDVYDFSWFWYPATDSTIAEARRRAVATALDGTRGLRFWAAFAHGQGKPLTLPEWGLSWRRDGHGGGDNVDFVDAVLGFVDDPANGVRSASYFNPPYDTSSSHNITAGRDRFPLAAAELIRLSTT